MTKKTQSSAQTVRLGEDLPPAQLARLIAKSQAYTKQANANRIVYPDPDTLDFDSPEAEFEVHPSGFLSNDFGKRNRKQKKSKSGGGGGGGGGKGKLPNPQVVLAEVQKTFGGIPMASSKGNLAIGEFNAEFGDSSKAKFFKDPYEEIFKHFHLVFLSEVDSGFVADVAKYLGYTGYCSTANTRSQAVGFLVHPRLQVVGQPVEYTAVGNVQGVPDLRPAYLLHLKDTTTGETFDAVVVHLKSMRGGPKVTAAVRYKQLDILQQALGASFKGMIAGDMNFVLDDPKVNDGDPLLTNGYTLVAANDHTATQAMKSRIDGFFIKGLKNVKFYQVRAYFANPLITRAFSDHAVTNVQLVYCDAAHQLGSSPNAGCSGGKGDKDYPIDANGAFTQAVRLMDLGKFGSGGSGDDKPGADTE